MMLGELEYEDIYYPQKDTINLTIHNNTISGVIEDGFKTQYFPFTAHVVLLTFIIFVSIIVMNLLFGLAVTDVQVKLKLILHLNKNLIIVKSQRYFIRRYAFFHFRNCGKRQNYNS